MARRRKLTPSEDLAVKSALFTVTQIPGINDVMVFFQDVDFGGEVLPVMYVRYVIEGNMPADEFERQLENVTKQVVKSFVLTDSIPAYLVVGAHSGTFSLIEGYVVPYYSAAMWYAGRLDDGPFQFSWLRLSDLEDSSTGA